MRILLDTHLFIWWLRDDHHLSKQARAIITNAEIIYISSVSIWEAAIKIQLGKLAADIDELIEAIESEGFSELSLQAHHVAAISRLPAIHRDPFDRMLIAQAITEPLLFYTSDKILQEYAELVQLV